MNIELRTNPKVSIIILTYNSRSTLKEILDKAIMSALTQNYPNIEVITADNGSQDDTYKYIKDKYGTHVKVIRFNKNHGFVLEIILRLSMLILKRSTSYFKILMLFYHKTTLNHSLK
jgi:cellulose synthase/poly-beta-1,6-N-acetylglucosamine synthase-like glycosyltransferase